METDMVTIDDMYAAYCDRCGAAGPVATRHQLQADFWSWAKAWGKPLNYTQSGLEYLDSEDGPFDPFTLIIWGWDVDSRLTSRPK